MPGGAAMLFLANNFFNIGYPDETTINSSEPQLVPHLMRDKT